MWTCNVCQTTNLDTLEECLRCDVPRDHDFDPAVVREELGEAWIEQRRASMREVIVQYSLRSVLVAITLASAYLALRGHRLRADGEYQRKLAVQQQAEQLLQSMHAVNELSKKHELPVLYVACATGRTDCVRELLRKGESLNASGWVKPLNSNTRQTESVLAVSIRCNHLEVTKVLIEHGADPRWEFGSTAGILEFLTRLERGIFVSGAVGSTSLIRDEFFDLLITSNRDIDQPDASGMTARDYAMRSGRVAWIHRLLDLSATAQHAMSPPIAP